MSIPVACSHQKTAPFSKVVLKGYFETMLIPDASEHEVGIETDERTLKNMRMEVEDGELTIKYKPKSPLGFFNFSWGPQKCVVKISAAVFEGICLKGAGALKSTGVLRSQSLEVKVDGTGTADLEIETQQYCQLKLEGSSKIKAKVNSPSLKAKLEGTGKMQLEGNVQEAKFTLEGVGQIDAGKLICQRATAQMKGLGEIVVNATELVEETRGGVGTIKNLIRET